MVQHIIRKLLRLQVQLSYQGVNDIVHICIEGMLELVLNCITWRLGRTHEDAFTQSKDQFSQVSISFESLRVQLSYHDTSAYISGCAGIGRQLHLLKAKYIMKDLMKVWDCDLSFPVVKDSICGRRYDLAKKSCHDQPLSCEAKMH